MGKWRWTDLASTWSGTSKFDVAFLVTVTATVLRSTSDFRLDVCIAYTRQRERMWVLVRKPCLL